jgi:DHA2 family multidrug resistance protein-like MFS transporter
MHSPPSTPLATRRDWLGLAILALPCLVYSMDLTVLNLAIPAISAELRPSGAQLLWMIDIYGFFVAGFLITMGTLGDRIGRRRLLLWGAAAFALASLVAAFARTAEALIAARALLGIAGATLAPSTMSLIRNMFHDERERQFAFGVWIASFSVGGALGPLVGGVVLQFAHWGVVFLVAVPVMLLLLALGPKLLPEFRDPAAGSIDAVSVASSIAAVLTTIYGFKSIAEGGVTPLALGCLAAGAVIATFFLRRQRQISYPLLDLALFGQPRFSATLAAYALSSIAMFGTYIFITQYLQLVLGLWPLQAGLATVPWSLGFVAGSLLTPKLTARWAATSVFVGGLVVAAVGFACVSLVGPTSASLAGLIGATLLMSLGMAPAFTLGTEIIVTAAPPERAGAASALSETAAEFSGAIGIAVLGSIGLALYRLNLAADLPATLDAAARSDALATLGGALAVSATLDSGSAAALQLAARGAFMQGLQFTALIGAVSLVVAALVAAHIFRGARAPQQETR